MTTSSAVSDSRTRSRSDAANAASISLRELALGHRLAGSCSIPRNASSKPKCCGPSALRPAAESNASRRRIPTTAISGPSRGRCSRAARPSSGHRTRSGRGSPPTARRRATTRGSRCGTTPSSRGRRTRPRPRSCAVPPCSPCSPTRGRRSSRGTGPSHRARPRPRRPGPCPAPGPRGSRRPGDRLAHVPCIAICAASGRDRRERATDDPQCRQLRGEFEIRSVKAFDGERDDRSRCPSDRRARTGSTSAS